MPLATQTITYLIRRKITTAFENANFFFITCEALEGWAGYKPYVADNATFTAQNEPLAEVNSAEAYCEWVAGLGTVTAPGATYDLYVSCLRCIYTNSCFFATYHAKYTGEGGPVSPTNKETHSEYVYFLKMNDDNKVEHMTKGWNEPWAMKELG